MKSRFIYLVLFAAFFSISTGYAQLRTRSAGIKREDPNKSDLSKEDGAVYIEGLLQKGLLVKITKSAPTYTNLTGDRWIGNVLANQNAELLAISEKAYRVRAKAKQGQIAGWISKAAVEGITKEMEADLTKIYERNQIVEDLIAHKQVALGMTQDEVTRSIGNPDKRNSKIDKNGRKDTLDYITYDRVPQQSTAFDQFGRPYTTTTYIEVETGRVTIEFENQAVSSIEESEGLNFQQGNVRIVPPPIFFY